MKRLWVSMLWDVQLQFRYGFYYAGAVVAVIWMLLLSLASAEGLRLLLPPFLFLNLVMTTFYFIGGLVLLEKKQGTLAGLVLTPLRQHEYLAAKVTTLAILAAIECVLVVLVVYGVGLNWALLLAGLLSLAVVYTLFGFVAVSRFDSINAYIVPSGFIVALLTLPLVDYFGLWASPIFYLLPTQAALLLLAAAFRPIAPWQMVYGLLATIFWAGLGLWWSRRVFHRFTTGDSL
jgi:fluoroquinolone transport system permease protein